MQGGKVGAEVGGGGGGRGGRVGAAVKQSLPAVTMKGQI